MPIMSGRWCSAQCSNRPYSASIRAYQPDAFVVERSDAASSFRSHIAHSAGVSVNETNIDSMIATADVKPNE